MAQTKIEIEIPSDLRRIREVSSKISEELRHRNVSEDDIFDVRLCLEEAMINAIRHGNRGEKKLPTRISYTISDQAISIEVEDEGKGFRSKDVPDPTEEDNLIKSSGRGVYLIRRLMDSAVYNEKGNKITMIKKIK